MYPGQGIVTGFRLLAADAFNPSRGRVCIDTVARDAVVNELYEFVPAASPQEERDLTEVRAGRDSVESQGVRARRDVPIRSRDADFDHASILGEDCGTVG